MFHPIQKMVYFWETFFHTMAQHISSLMNLNRNWRKVENSDVFSRIFRRKNPAIKIGLSGQAAHSWLTFWLTFLQIRFSRKEINLRASNFTHGFLRVSAFIWCHVLFSWFPIFGWKMHFLEIGIFFFFFFTNFCIYSKVFGWTFIGM